MLAALVVLVLGVAHSILISIFCGVKHSTYQHGNKTLLVVSALVSQDATRVVWVEMFLQEDCSTLECASSYFQTPR